MADDPTPDPKADPKKDDPTDDLGDAGKKALDAERKARRDAEKKASDLEARLKQLEDKDKGEVERLTEQVSSLTSELATEKGRATRLEVALDKGLTKTQARRLVGDTVEDLIADADDLLSSFKPAEEPAPPAPTPGGRPKEDLKTGATPAPGEPTKDDLRKVIDEIPR